MERIDTTATVETPERVSFRYRLAGPGQRVAALAIDLAVQLAAMIALGLFAALFTTVPTLGEIGTGVALVGVFAVQWLYGAVFETLTHGRTPGKAALELRVVKVDGAPAQFRDFLLRNLVRAADFLPFGYAVAAAVMAFDPRLRRLGDLVAGTVVIAEDKSSMLDGVRIDPPVSEEERQALPARIDLRPEEIEVIESFLRRRRSLSDERAEELANHFAPALVERTGIEAPTAERVLTLAYARVTGKDREPAIGKAP
ncbi:MAG: RDD family protein [Myxococcota bacterium]